MAETRGLERLSASDLYVLLWDDFGWSGNIGVLAVLDGTGLLDGEGRVRIEAVRRHLEPRLHMVPRFRQRLYRPGLGLGWPLWVDSASFDLADHVRVFPLAAPGGQDQLLQACEQLAQRRLDPSRPLWEAWLLPSMSGDGRTLRCGGVTPVIALHLSGCSPGWLSTQWCWVSPLCGGAGGRRCHDSGASRHARRARRLASTRPG